MKKITINQLAGNLNDFKKISDEYPLTEPENTCALLIIALNLYVKNPADGIAALNILRGPRVMNGMDIQFVKDRFRGKEYLAGAYFEGASPENNYTVHAPYTLIVTDDPRPQDIEEGYIRKYLKTTGADAPRPLRLRKKKSTGEWFLFEYSSILTGIRVPASEDPFA